MMENRHIVLGLGNVSLSETLGSYYIDMRPGPRSLHEQHLVKPRLARLRCMWHGTGSS